MADRQESARQALEVFGRAEFDRGYRQAVEDLKAAAEALLEPVAGDPPERAELALTARQLEALDYLRDHPGATAWSTRELGISHALYQLAKLGLVEKQGSAFYVRSANAAAEQP